IHTICSPDTKIVGLLPGNPNYRIVVIRRVAEIILNIWFIISQFFSPYQGIGKGFVHNRSIVAKSIFQPVQVLAVMYVGYLSFIYKEGWNGNATGNIVPIAHYIFFFSPHNKRATLYKYKARPGFGIFYFRYMEIPHVFVIIIPACYVRLRFFLSEKTTVFTRG